MARARFGITLYPLSARQNAATTLAPSFTAADLSPSINPVEDNFSVINQAVVTRSTPDGSGGTATYTQEAGLPYAPDGDGGASLYSTGINLNVESDDVLKSRASWAVHVGTVDEDRVSKLTLNLRRRPALAGPWLATPIGGRITVDGFYSTGGRAPDVLLEGREQVMSRFGWTVSANCSPYSPYEVARTGAKVDSGSGVMALPAAVGATSIFVTVPDNTRPGVQGWITSAPLWSLMVGPYGPIVVTFVNAAIFDIQELNVEPLEFALAAGLRTRLAPADAAVIPLGGQT